MSDRINGTSANETLNAQDGGGTITGGGGHDTFVITIDSGHTVITDFGGVGAGARGESNLLPEFDTLSFEGSGLTPENMILEYDGENTIITFVGVDNFSVRLENFDFTDLDNLPNGTANILFDGQTSGTDAFDVFNSHTQNNSRVWNKNSTTFLNDSDNTIMGFSDSDDVINGMGGNDYIRGRTGDDILRGQAGDDTLRGGRGDDILEGGIGNDLLRGGRGEDLLDGGEGEDKLYGGRGNDVLNGGAGNDVIRGWLGNDTIHGDEGNDILYGDHGDDAVYGDAGDDIIIQRGGFDILDGGADYDVLSYEYYNDGVAVGIDLDLNRATDQVVKDYGTDNITGFEEYRGSNLADTMVGDDSGVLFFGMGGDDVITGGEGADVLHGGQGNDTIYGLGGNDNFYGNEGNDIVYGGEGNDTYYASTGSDTFDGEGGLNNANYQALTSGIVADLSATQDHVLKAGGEIDQVFNVFRFTGTNFDDTIVARGNTVTIGAEGNDTITGQGGAEYLYGNQGNDILNGKGYNDRLYGGSGDDTFIFERGGGRDTIVFDDAGSTNDVLSFDVGVDHDQLWFEQAGVDLVVSVIGTNDQITLQSWYGIDTTVDSITSGDGFTLSASDVQTLVDAMSAFAAPAAGQTELSDAGLDDDLASVLSATWS